MARFLDEFDILHKQHCRVSNRNSIAAITKKISLRGRHPNASVNLILVPKSVRLAIPITRCHAAVRD